MLRRSLTLSLSCAPHRPASERSDWCVGWCWGLFALILFGMVSAQVLSEQRAEAQSGEPTFIQTHHDTIPNFCQSPTITAVGSGNWSSGGTWSLGRAPAAGDVVMVPAGRTVTYDAAAGAADCVGIHGKVTFRTDAQTKLTAANVMVYADGTLEVGTELSPVSANARAEIVIADKALDTVDDGVGVFDPRQFGTGLIALGKVTMHGAAMNETFVRLATEPRTGDTRLTLSQAVTGWRAGDKLILPDSRHLKVNEHNSGGGNIAPKWEELTLSSVSTDGRILTLSSPLAFDHKGARDGDGVLEFLPHVGNLTRNVIIRSENPAGIRGHTLLTHRADVDIRYVGFRNLGRTTIGPLDNATFNASGQVTHIGTNQLARYPLHAHHLIGPVATPENGNQFTLTGNAVDDDSADNRHKWGITVHGSHYGLVRQNVVYNATGWGIGTEDSSESFNLIEKNFVVRTSGTGKREDTGPADQGMAFWLQGPNNYLRDNVAANALRGYVIFQAGNTGVAKIPAFKGADPSIQGQSKDMPVQGTPLLEFSGNEVYGGVRDGMTIWNIGTAGETSPEVRYDIGESVIRDFRAWHFHANGIWFYPVNRITLDGAVMRGDWMSGIRNTMTTGITSGADYMTRQLTVRNADIQGLLTGILLPQNGNPIGATGDQLSVTTIEDSYLRNYASIVNPTTYNGNLGGAALAPKRTVIRNVRFDNLNVADNPDLGHQAAIAMGYIVRSGANLVQSDEVLVYGYNRVAGDNFQVFYNEQRPDFVVPVSKNTDDTGPSMVGAPLGDIGFTNAQLVAKYPNGATILGQFYPVVAIAGAAAPCLDKTTRPEIAGYACKIGSSPGDSPGGGAVLKTPADTIPNFCFNFTKKAAANGAWTESTTWEGGQVPGAGDVVWIPSGRTVTFDALPERNAKVSCIGIDGALTFATSASTKLTTDNLLVYPSGTLKVGTSAQPVSANATAEIIIANKPLDTTTDPSQYGTALIALGKVTMHGRALNQTFVRLAAEPRAGDITLKLAESVTGWQAGDKLILPDTRHLLWSDWNNFTPQWEELILASVAVDGKTLTLTRPLQFNHLGAHAMDGALDFLPHVGNLTRNVRIRSENFAGIRGHVFLAHRANADIRYAEFLDLGRTSTKSTNDTTFDASGNVTHIGTNQRGRNPLYLHGLIGSQNPPPGKPAFSLVGNSIRNQASPLPRWGIGLDGGSSNGLLRDNVTYRIAGVGIMVTGAGSLPNLIDHNFMVRTMDDTSQLPSFGENGYDRVLVDNQDPLGYNGEALYVYQGAGNSIRNNVAANFRETGFYFLFGTITDSSGNEAYGPGSTGYALPGVGGAWGFNPDPQAGKSVIRDAKIWHVFGGAVEPWLSNKVILEDLIIRGDPSLLGNPNNFTSGVAGTLFLAKDFTVRGADIQGMQTGFSPGAEAGGGVQTVENSFFNNGTDIFIKPMAHYARDSSWLGPRKTMLRKVRFGTNPRKQYTILMYVPEDPRGNIIQKDHVLVYDFNGVVSDNFQVFYREQAADYVLPKADPEKRTGSPEAGLTNQQNWDKYRIAFAGAVTPCMTTRSTIQGFVCPIDALPPEVNQPPTVNAGADQVVLLGNPATLNGTVTDDDLPNPPAKVTIAWSKVSGPGTVTFGDGTKEDTTATFSAEGTYVLRLTGNDSLLSRSDNIQITATATGGGADLLAYWPFDDGAGTVAKDFSGNGRDGTLRNGPVWAQGRIGKALSFDNADDYVSFTPFLTSSAYSISTWINRTGADYDPWINCPYLLVEAGTSKIFRWPAFDGRKAVMNGAWTHVLYTVENGTEKFFVNGSQTALQSGGGACSPSNIGGDVAAGHLFGGLLDEVCIFGKALSQGEVSKLYNNGIGLPCDQLNSPPPTEELCLSPRPENRVRLASQDFSGLPTTLTITDPQGLIIYSGIHTPTSKEGEIHITDPTILAKINDTTTYTLTAHPESHRRRKMTLLGSTLKASPCDSFPGSPFGFLDESGPITIQHLVRLIAHYRAQTDAQVNRAFLSQKFTLRDLISVIRLYVMKVGQE